MNFFDLIKRIKEGKKALDNEDFKEYTPYLVPRFLSMNITNIQGAAILNKYTFLPLSKKQHYELMLTLPWDSSYAKYIKGEKSSDKCLKELVGIVMKSWKNTSVKQSEIVETIKRKLLTGDEIEKILVRTGTETRKKNKLLKYYKEKA